MFSYVILGVTFALVVLAPPASGQVPKGADRTRLEAMLLWTGYLDGEVGHVSRPELDEAIKAFQRAAGGQPTATLDAHQLQKLHDDYWRIRRYWNFSKTTDSRAYELWLPRRLLQSGRFLIHGSRYEAADGGFVVETFEASPNDSLDILYHRHCCEINIGKKIEGAQRFEKRDVKGFTLDVSDDERKVSFRAFEKDGVIRGLAITWDPRKNGKYRVLRNAIASNYGPFEDVDGVAPPRSGPQPHPTAPNASDPFLQPPGTSPSEPSTRTANEVIVTVPPPPTARSAAKQEPAAPPGQTAIQNIDAGRCTERRLRTEGGNDVNLQVFFGTNRKSKPDPHATGPRPEIFGDDDAERVEFGYAIVKLQKDQAAVVRSLPPLLSNLPFGRTKVGNQPPPRSVSKVNATDEREFNGELSCSLLMRQNHSGSDVFVFIHGYNTSFYSALERAAELSYRAEFGGAPVIFSWPSRGARDDYSSYTQYDYDYNMVGQAILHLKKFTTALLQNQQVTRISFIAHSMGNKALLDLMVELRHEMDSVVNAESLRSAIRTKLDQIIMAAPDVAVGDFRNQVARAAGIGRRWTLYASGADVALMVSRQKNANFARAGAVLDDGPTVIPGVDTIDATSLATDIFSMNHSTFDESQLLIDDISRLLNTGAAPKLRLQTWVTAKTKGQLTYWFVRPARVANH